ncbi:MAG: hypothetical protein RR235_08780 [Oscillospiraceae bacterium]
MDCYRIIQLLTAEALKNRALALIYSDITAPYYVELADALDAAVALISAEAKV